MNDQNVTLDSLIVKLKTNEGKSRALAKAVKRKVVEGPEHYQRALHACINSKLFFEGADLAILNGDLDRAINLHLQGGSYFKAADIAVQKGDVERAIDIYSSRGNPYSAAELAEKCQMIFKAMETYQEAKLWNLAANLAIKFGLFEDAFQIFERGKLYRQAFELAAKRGDKERTTKYKKLESEHEPDWHDYSDRDPVKSEIKHQAYQAQKKKNYRRAGELLESIEDWHFAANMFSSAKNHIRAGIDYEKARSYQSAGSEFLDAKDFSRAALNYERGGEFRLAGLCARLGNNEEDFNTYNLLADILKEPKHEWSPRFNVGNVMRVMMESLTIIPLWFMDDLRRFIQNPKTKFLNIAKDYLKEPPNLSPELSFILQNSSQLFNAYLFNIAIYNIVDLASPRMNEKMKLGVSQAVANGLIVAYEMGLLTTKNPDLSQIPSAIVGSALYLGTHYVTRRIYGFLDENERRFHKT